LGDYHFGSGAGKYIINPLTKTFAECFIINVLTPDIII